MTTPTPTPTLSPLATLLADPTLSALLSLPHLAKLAASARSAEKDNAATLAAARHHATHAPTVSADGQNATGSAPIIAAEWLPTIPTIDPTYTMPPRMRSDLLASMASDTAAHGHAASILIGQAGTGKTEAVRFIAAATGRPFFKLDASCVQDACEWFGSQTIVGGRVGWQDSPFVAALNTPQCIIMVDEINRASQRAMNALLSLCDSFGSASFPQRSAPVTIASGVHIFAAANIGAEHSGTGQITPALRDRFRSIPCEYLQEAAEIDLLRTRFPDLSRGLAKALVNIATRTRAATWSTDVGGTPISTRGLLLAARYAVTAPTHGGQEADALGALIAGQPAESIGGGSSPSQQLAAIVASETARMEATR